MFGKRYVPPNSRSSEVTYEGDITPPIVSYASALRASPMISTNLTPASTGRTSSAVVDRRPIRKGIRYFYSHGAVEMPAPTVPTNGAGGVDVSLFQTALVQLHDWVINVGWGMAGRPRNLGLSFRVGQLPTQVTGGSGPGRMTTKQLLTGVQTIPRYPASPRRYATRSAKA